MTWIAYKHTPISYLTWLWKCGWKWNAAAFGGGLEAWWGVGRRVGYGWGAVESFVIVNKISSLPVVLLLLLLLLL